MTKLIARNVSYSHNSGRLLVDLTCEALIEDAAETYEVQCPQEPENEPDQPEEHIPIVPVFPEEPVGGGGIGSELFLSRNSFRSLRVDGTFRPHTNHLGIQGIDDPQVGKSCLTFPNIGAYVDKLLDSSGDHDVNGNIVTSNNYIYYIEDENGLVRIYRKAYRYPNFGQNDVFYAVTTGPPFPDVFNNITLVEENVVAYIEETNTSINALKTLDLSDGSITTLLTTDRNTTVGSDLYRYRHRLVEGLYTIVGSDGKIYIIFPLNLFIVPDVGDNNNPLVRYLIYNYTDGVQETTVELNTAPGHILDASGNVELGCVAIVQSEIVFVYYLHDPLAVLPVAIHSVNVETQTGQRTLYDPVDQHFPYQAMSDRINRRVYISAHVTANAFYPILEYNLGDNTAVEESRYDNLPYLAQDGEYAYKIINSSTAPSAIRIFEGTLIGNPSSSGVGTYDKDNASPDIVTLVFSGNIERSFNKTAINLNSVINVGDGGSSTDIPFSDCYMHLQGDVIIVQGQETGVFGTILGNQKFWVIY